MLDTLSNLLAPPVLERLTLVLNHVLRAEPVALDRLRPHAGRTLAMQLTDWPALLPAPVGLAWRVTPAGLLEWCGLPGAQAAAGPAAATSAAPGAAGAAAAGASASAASPGPATGPATAGTGDLRIAVDAHNPAALLARALAGVRPAVQVDGDAALAADVGWLLQNLRWDVAADLERLFGPVLAHQLHQAGRALARGLRAALDAADAASSSPWADKLAQISSRLGPRRR